MALQLPQEFENYMESRLGPQFEGFRQSFEKPAPVSIRFNPRKTSHYAGETIPWSMYGRYLPERPIFTLDPRLHAGAYYVQEASSMFLEQALQHSVDLAKPLNVLDLCAAPGGKSSHLLSMLSGESLLISNEVIRNRTSVLSENIQKWGHDNVIVTNSDPSDFQRLPEFFDLILVDAPCSGEGLFRKDPDSMKEWSPKNVESCSLRQRRIVSDVWPSLRQGGVLIYSTCTYNEKENLENMTWLHSKQDLECIQLVPKKEWGVETINKGKVFGYQCFPHRVKGEGLFLAAVRKKNGGSQPNSKSKDVLKYPTNSQVREFSPWIISPESQCFFLHHQVVKMLPVSKKMEMLLALRHLNVMSVGTAVAEIMKNKLVPEHALALSIKLRKENIARLSVDLSQALIYLRKNPLSLPSERLGFALIEFEGLGLGWVNVLQNRLNNLYPASWRILMEGPGTGQ